MEWGLGPTHWWGLGPTHFSGVLVGSCGHVNAGHNRRMGVLKQTSAIEQPGWHCVLCVLWPRFNVDSATAAANKGVRGCQPSSQYSFVFAVPVSWIDQWIIQLPASESCTIMFLLLFPPVVVPPDDLWPKRVPLVQDGPRMVPGWIIFLLSTV